MGDCRFQFLVAAYHDRELDDETRPAFEGHVASCKACSAELAVIRDLSARIAASQESEGDAKAVARLHRAVDRVAGNGSRNPPLLRTAGLLTALAASLLIISGVWLLDLGQVESVDGNSLPGDNRQFVVSPDWERVALTLRADPRPGIGGDSVFSPRYAAAIDWMLDNLVPGRPAKRG